MKKILGLFLGSMMAFSFSVAGRDPVIKVNTSNSNYDVRIDGRAYSNAGNIYLYEGNHEVEVYKVKKSLFGKRKVLVSRSSFDLSSNDIMIYVDDAGQVRLDNAGNSATPAKKTNAKETVQNSKSGYIKRSA
jgi:hypothetical protein